MDALIHTDQSEATSIFLPRNIGPNERPDSCRIRQWDCSKVQNERARAVGTHLGLKPEYIGKR